MEESSTPKPHSEQASDIKRDIDSNQPVQREMRRRIMGMRTRINGRNRVTQTPLLRALIPPIAPIAATVPEQKHKEAAE